MSARERIHASVGRRFDLADLNPVERRMVDTVIDATVAEVVEALREQGNDPEGYEPLALVHAADFIEREFGGGS